MRKTLLRTTVLIVLAGFPACVLADDYSPELLGESYRDYAGKKIQEGYYPEIFTRIDMRQRNRVSARNQAEQIVAGSYQAGQYSTYAILSLSYLQQYNAGSLKQEISKFTNQRIGTVSALTEFTYLPNSDGKISYFKDGLTSRVMNERVVNEYGVVSMKNTYNMKYNDDRLLIGYEADVTDNLGNVSHLVSKDMKYMPGAKFYATEETNAHKNMAEYTIIETDAAGNITTSEWKAGSYEGKLLRAFSVNTKNEVFGDKPYTTTSHYERHNITYENNDPDRVDSYEETGVMPNSSEYRLFRSDIEYNDRDQITEFHEERWDKAVDGSETKTTTDAEFEYVEPPHLFGDDVDFDPKRLSKSTFTTTTEEANGATDTETKVINYDYDKNFKLTGASGTIEKNGMLAPTIEYRDAAGHTLSTETDEEGNITKYFYQGTDGEVIEVAAADVAEVEVQDTYATTGTIAFEIVGGTPMVLQQDLATTYYSSDGSVKSTGTTTIKYTNALVNNMPRVVSYEEISTDTSARQDPNGDPETSTRDVTTTYTYDSKGNLIDASATGAGSGYEFTAEGWKHYTDTITITFEMKLGQPTGPVEDIEREYWLEEDETQTE